MESKICRICGEEKSLDEYYYRQDSGKYRSECKKCRDKQKSEYALKNKDKLKEYQKKYREENKEYQKNYRDKNKEKIAEYNTKYREEDNPDRRLKHKKAIKKYYEKNKDEIAEKNKKYRKNNKDLIEKRNNEYREKNKSKIALSRKVYYQKNKRIINKKAREYSSRPEVILRKREKGRKYTLKRRLESSVFKLNQNTSRAIRGSLKFKGMSKKSRHWEDLVGYTVQELKRHLEKLFLTGMTWENYGKQNGEKCWQIDHILPLSFFVYTSTYDTEFKYCWSLNNLQPLWAKDNISKGNRLSLRKIAI